MQTRIVIHKAYNRHGLTNILVVVGGQLIALPGHSFATTLTWCTFSAAKWQSCRFTQTVKNIRAWKHYSRIAHNAHRFEQITVLGETRCKHV